MTGRTMRTFMTVAVLVVAMPSLAGAQNRVIVVEEESLTVELEKPEAFYILSPSNLTYTSVDPEASFLDELYETVEEAPF
jgi:hypothetical protein